jgi:diguanylate cyclase (GGDEF)-like protein
MKNQELLIGPLAQSLAANACTSPIAALSEKGAISCSDSSLIQPRPAGPVLQSTNKLVEDGTVELNIREIAPMDMFRFSAHVEELYDATKPEDVLSAACKFCAEAVGSSIEVAAYRTLDQHVELAAYSGSASVFPDSFDVVDCAALRRGRIFLSSDASCCDHAMTGPYACIPLWGGGEVLGQLTTRGSLQLAWQSSAIESIGRHTSLALSTLKRISRLRLDSFTDPLIGLHSRRYLNCVLDREFRRAARSTDQPGFCLAVLDLNKFKPINDTYGHAAGDAYLVGLGSCLHMHVRGQDVAARTGGDEFSLLFVNAGIDQALKRLEQIRKAIKLLPQFPSRDPISVAIGLASSRDFWTPTKLAEAADAAQGHAKREGLESILVAPFLAK